MDQGYETWLTRQGYNENTVNAQLYRAGRVEQYYGDFDQHFEADGLTSVIDVFIYTTEDARQHKPNPTLIPYRGAVFGNMAGYKFSVRLYRRYRMEMRAFDGEEAEATDNTPSHPTRSARICRGTSKPGISPIENPVTLEHFGIDGFAALTTLIDNSHYKSLAQAMASLTLFSHPETVRQTGGKAVFRTIRGPRSPGAFAEVNGMRVMLDDNKSASDAFKWVHGITSRLRDIQFNHVYTASQDVEAYTSLANICVTPAFIAKLTDSTSPITSALLKYRVFDLYGWTPVGIEAPNKPEGYDELDWAPTLPPVDDVKAALEARMARKPKDRTVKSVKELGWLFGEA